MSDERARRPVESSGVGEAPRRATRPLATYRLWIEYEGTRYSGWQVQRNAPTVAGTILRALEETGFPVVELGGAGRTDAGVHALEQCAHLRLEQRVDPAELCRALNRRLPRDVHVLGAASAATSFHARHDAVSRSYLYQISRRRTALAKPWVWWVRERLDLERLRAGAALLPGRHDFRHFADTDAAAVAPGSPAREKPRRRPSRGRREVEDAAPSSTLVEVESVDIAEDGALVLVRIVASHFLWKMVRRLVGTLVRAGAGELDVAVLARLLEGGALGADDPRPAQWTAPSSGLFLERVLYAGDPPLDPIAAVTRIAAGPPEPAGPSHAPDEGAPRPRRQPRRPKGTRPGRPAPDRRRRPRRQGPRGGKQPPGRR